MAKAPYDSVVGRVVLRILANATEPLPITKIAKHAYADRAHTALLMRTALRDGLVNAIKRGRTHHYHLTDQGRAYVAAFGELPARLS